MKSIFDADACEEIKNRLENLSENAKANWGKMTVGQMLVHCSKPIELALGDIEVDKPNWLKRKLFRLISPSLYNDKPWKQGLPTAKEFVITNTVNFNAEKEKLKTKIEEIRQSESLFKPNKEHPYFGTFTAEQWGKSAYKHLDHHLKQFGA
ncbi:MAG: hypothetical protein Tsb0033_10810 [Winogradskyella sp.]